MPKISVGGNGQGVFYGQGSPFNPGRGSGTLNAQTWIRIQRVARMEISGIADRHICANENIDYPALKYLRSLAEYQEVKDNLLQGHLTEMDKAIAGKVDILRGEIRNAVPAALRTLVDVVNQRRDLRTALAAATELLDRDPDQTFSKSRDCLATGSETGARVPDAVVESVTKDSETVSNDLAAKRVN